MLYQSLSEKLWTIEAPQRLEVGQKFLAEFLGVGWHMIEANNLRWMQKRAEVRLGAPTPKAKKLRITCYRFKDDPRPGVLQLTVTANGLKLGTQPIPTGEAEHHLAYELPSAGLAGREIQIVLEVNSVFANKDDNRQLGLVLGNLAWM